MRGARRWALASAGVGVLAVVWLGPLPDLAPRSFLAHMVMHMGVVAVAAPFLALSVAGSPRDPVRRLPRLFAPVPASALELVVVWGWHAPALHHAARSGAGVLVLEQGTFLAAGLLVWLSAFGGGRADRVTDRATDHDTTLDRAGAGVLGLLLTSMHMTLLGALLGLSPRPLYDHPLGTALGMTPLADQHLGGAVMLLVGGASYLAGGLYLTSRVLRGRRAHPVSSPGGAS